MTRLSNGTLGSLPAMIHKPAYDRNRVKTGIVHLGIGAFHRAHQAVYTDDVLASGDLGWGILGASLRSPDTRDALHPQDGLYAVNIRDGGGDELRVIGAVRDVLVAPENPAALLATMTDPGIRIVSLTVTEKGYCHKPATGELDPSHPDIRHDLEHPKAPRSAPGFIVEALARRRAAGCLFRRPALRQPSVERRRDEARAGRPRHLRDPDFGRFSRRNSPARRRWWTASSRRPPMPIATG
jgi:fructuronate reductase